MQIIDAVSAVSAISGSNLDFLPISKNTEVGFLEKLNHTILTSSDILSDSAVGKTVESHELMINLEMARQQLQLAVEVRNKLVDAYQELMRMQI